MFKLLFRVFGFRDIEPHNGKSDVQEDGTGVCRDRTPKPFQQNILIGAS